MTTVSIIIVNYYSETEVIRCIESIHANTMNIPNYEIIIVSNSPLSQQHADELEAFKNTQIIQFRRNGGFAKGCNAGAKMAKGEFLFLLNPDTRFLNDAVTNLLQFHKQHGSEAILAPFTYNTDGTVKPTVKNHLSLATLIHEALPIIGIFIPDTLKSGHYKVTETRQVDVVQGSALFLSRSLFNKLDGMDERFFMYWEENDLCLKAGQRGIKTTIVDAAKIEHQGAVSTSKHFFKMFLIQHTSRKLFIIKHFPHLVGINRILAVFGYSWRTLAAFLIGDQKRTKQFWNVLKWYIRSYDENISDLIDA